MAQSGSIAANFVVTFPNERFASIAASSVAVDDEVKAHRVSRTIVAEGSTVRVSITGADAKIVRVAAGGVLDMLLLATKTMTVFA